MEIDALRAAIKNRRIEWQRHSLERMLERNISRSVVLEAVMNGEIIEDYPEDQPFPIVLFLGWIGPKPIHVVVSYDSANQILFIITAYEPHLKHFKPDFKVRRKR